MELIVRNEEPLQVELQLGTDQPVDLVDEFMDGRGGSPGKRPPSGRGAETPASSDGDQHFRPGPSGGRLRSSRLPS